MDLFSKLQDVSAQSDPHHAKCLLNRWALEERQRQPQRQQQQQQQLEPLEGGLAELGAEGDLERLGPGWGVDESR